MASPIDWPGIVEKYRTALARVVVTLFAMARLDADGSPFAGCDLRVMMLPRGLHRTVLGHVRAAESALRRIIVIAARGLVVTVKPPAAHSCSSPQRGEGAQPFEPEAKRAGRMRGPDDSATGSIAVPHLPAGSPLLPAASRRSLTFRRATGTTNLPSANRPLTPAFQLFDPRKRFDGWWRGDWYAQARGDIEGPALPRPATAVAPLPDPHQHIPAGHLALRLRALKAALDDIAGQARRLAFSQARRKLKPNARSRPCTVQRPGYPPGYRKRHLHEVDGILHNVDCFARCLLNARPDTS